MATWRKVFPKEAYQFSTISVFSKKNRRFIHWYSSPIEQQLDNILTNYRYMCVHAWRSCKCRVSIKHTFPLEILENLLQCVAIHLNPEFSIHLTWNWISIFLKSWGNTISRMTSLPLGLRHATCPRTRVNLGWLPDDETILNQLSYILACTQ